mgnify:CR=1 FL=1
MIVKRDGFTEIHNVIKKTDKSDHDALAYMPITPIAQYNPWNLDKEFQDIYAIISSHTLIAKKSAEYNMDVYLCDTFTGVVKAGENDPHYKGGEHSDATELEVQLLLDIVGASANTLEGIFPEETSLHIPVTTKFAFCHIDVDTYQSTKEIMEWLWPKVEPGGIIVYDDYGMKGLGGVTKYINENYNNSDSIVIHNLNGHAIVIKR